MELTVAQQRVTEALSTLRDYQKEAAKQMYRHQRYLNYMDMGMGKSLVTAFVIVYSQAFPCIIICTKSAMGVWQDELDKWFGESAVIYAGKPKQREAAFKEFAVQGHKFIITNYRLAEELGQRFGIIPSVAKQKGPSQPGTTKPGKSLAPQPIPTHTGTKWQVGGLIADEIQRGGLFNHKTATYKVFQKLCAAIPSVHLLTGTPYRRGVVDFFGPLSLVAPSEFDSYWKYVAKWCVKLDSGFGASIERNPKDAVAFRAMLRQYSVIMKKEDYLHELPGKLRQTIPVEMDDEQRRIYDELTEQLYTVTDSGELIMTPSALSLMVRQRMLLACPQELGLKTRGVGIDTILEMSEDLVKDAKPFVIFTPFKKAVPWIKGALLDEHQDIRIFEITGELTADQFTAQWKGFQEFRGAASALICVIKSGASFHATRADTAFFLGYEWDFNENVQAEDRLNRMGQKQFVTCYYLMHRDTVDDEVAQKLNDKKYGADLVLSNEESFRAMIAKRGATKGRS